MGIQNIPDIYYDHYFTFPVNIEQMCSFIENHYDYKNDSSGIWKPTTNYLRKNKRKISIISNKNIFIIYEGKKKSYNEKNICSVIAMHDPETEYLNNKNNVSFFNSSGKNIKESLGIDFSDSLKSTFNMRMLEILKTYKNEFQILENKRIPFDPYDRILLEFSMNENIKPFCPHEELLMFNEKYIYELNNLCSRFCIDNKINRIIFCSVFVLSNPN